MSADFIAYIDEAGDDGLGKLKGPAQSGGQSSWLILGAMIVPADRDRLVPSWKREIRARFPTKQSRDLHWRKLNHNQRVVVSSDLASLPIHAALALSHKVAIPGSPHEETFKKPGYLYNHLIRWLLERLIDWCERQSPAGQASLRVVFSKRRGTDYETMKDCLNRLSRGQGQVPKDHELVRTGHRWHPGRRPLKLRRFAAFGLHRQRLLHGPGAQRVREYRDVLCRTPHREADRECPGRTWRTRA